MLNFYRPALGDKLQRLAGLSPQHLRVVELLVDRILLRFKSAAVLAWVVLVS